jgi:hypothetical protein
MLAMAAAVAVDTVGFGAPAEANGRGLGGMVRECVDSVELDLH